MLETIDKPTVEELAAIVRNYHDDLPYWNDMPPIGATVAIPDTDLYGPVLGYDFTRYGDAYIQVLTTEGLILIERDAL